MARTRTKPPMGINRASFPRGAWRGCPPEAAPKASSTRPDVATRADEERQLTPADVQAQPVPAPRARAGGSADRDTWSRGSDQGQDRGAGSGAAHGDHGRRGPLE